MRDLIERLERATGPDRELDAAIWCWRHPEYEMRNNGFTKHPNRFVQSKSPEYTGSLDAALTLFPNLPDTIDTIPRKACIAALRAREAAK